jgi:hemerythrin-like domain-containing protein
VPGGTIRDGSTVTGGIAKPGDRNSYDLDLGDATEFSLVEVTGDIDILLVSQGFADGATLPGPFQYRLSAPGRYQLEIVGRDGATDQCRFRLVRSSMEARVTTSTSASPTRRTRRGWPRRILCAGAPHRRIPTEPVRSSSRSGPMWALPVTTRSASSRGVRRQQEGMEIMDSSTTGGRVDTWEMVVVHRMFRREFRQAPDLIRGVADGDVARAEVVGEFYADLTEGLHHHHAGEDELLWPTLLERVGSMNADLVRRMEKQHEVVAGLLDRVNTLLPQWRARADAAGRDELADLYGQASVALDEHLTDEENEVLPLVSVHITQAEWDALGKRGQQGLPKGSKGLVFLGALLEDATPDERARFVKLLPGPVRLLWKSLGGGIHRRAMVRLRGTG